MGNITTWTEQDFGKGTKEIVILAVSSTCGEDKAIIEKVGRIFGETSNGKEYLDILFLTDAAEHNLRRTCKPF